jgi:hypothetical protein
VAGAEAAAFDAPERQRRHAGGDQALVHAHVAALDALGECHAAFDVARPDAGIQAVFAVVGERQRLLGVAHRHHGHDRSERFLAHDAHAVRHTGDHGGFEEVAGVGTATLAPAQDAGALHDGVGQMLLDDGELARAREGAVVDVGVGAVRAHAKRAHARHELLGEGRGDRLLDVHPFDRHADLAAHEAPAPGGRARGAVEVGVGEHDHRVFAAQLEQHGREPFAGALHDALARLR